MLEGSQYVCVFQTEVRSLNGVLEESLARASLTS